jgi:hypothetical protein
VCQPGQTPKRISVCGERVGDGGWLVDVPRRVFVCVDMIPCECDREGSVTERGTVMGPEASPSTEERWKSPVVRWEDASPQRQHDLTVAWQTGHLSWKLDPNQYGVYKAIRQSHKTAKTQADRIFLCP